MKWNVDKDWLKEMLPYFIVCILSVITQWIAVGMNLPLLLGGSFGAFVIGILLTAWADAQYSDEDDQIEDY